MQNIMQVEHRGGPLSEYYHGLVGRGWPLTCKYFRRWNTGDGHCHDIQVVNSRWMVGSGCKQGGVGSGVSDVNNKVR
jgi:hypothetical protein